MSLLDPTTTSYVQLLSYCTSAMSEDLSQLIFHLINLTSNLNLTENSSGYPLSLLTSAFLQPKLASIQEQELPLTEKQKLTVIQEPQLTSVRK